MQGNPGSEKKRFTGKCVRTHGKWSLSMRQNHMPAASKQGVDNGAQ